MSNDFINRRNIDDRRKRRDPVDPGPGTPQTTIKYAHLLPNWNTYILYRSFPGNTAAPFAPLGYTTTHWSGITHLAFNPDGSPIHNTTTELPVALYNPWNDAADRVNAGSGNTYIPRTPTRTIFGFNTSQIPQAANILSADLNLTVSGSSYWITNQQIQVNRNLGSLGSDPFNDRVWVTFNFDGSGTTRPGDEPGARAVGFGGGRNTFSWYRFLDLRLFGVYNPVANAEYDGSDTQPLNPHSLKRWYQWGARQFHLHMPFGRPSQSVNGPEKLAYQADAYLCAAEGFTGPSMSAGGLPTTPTVSYNDRCTWLTEDFIPVWRSLITGTKDGALGEVEWNDILTWYNPSDPIRVSVYAGALTFGGTEQNQYPRWNQQYPTQTSAFARLKESYQPYIDCGMKIGIDSLVTNAGPIPGQFIATAAAGSPAGNYLLPGVQAAWWEFFTYLANTVGVTNLYCESHPERRPDLITGNTIVSPYLSYIQDGMGIMSAEEWSYQNFPSRHTFAEIGDKSRYFRGSWWSGLQLKTKRNDNFPSNPPRSLPRYPDFDIFGTTWNDNQGRPATVGETEYTQGDRRFVLNDVQSGYGSVLAFNVIARNILDPFYNENEPIPGYNKTKPEIGISNYLLQDNYIIGSCYTVNGYGPEQRFGNTFANVSAFNSALSKYRPVQSVEIPPLDAVLLIGNPTENATWTNNNGPDGNTKQWLAAATGDIYYPTSLFPTLVKRPFSIVGTSNNPFLYQVFSCGDVKYGYLAYPLIGVTFTQMLNVYSAVCSTSFNPIETYTDAGGHSISGSTPRNDDFRIRAIPISPYDGDRNVLDITRLVRTHFAEGYSRGGNTLSVMIAGAGVSFNGIVNNLGPTTDNPFIESRLIIPETLVFNQASNNQYYQNYFKTVANIRFHSINAQSESPGLGSLSTNKIGFYKNFYKRSLLLSALDIAGISQSFVGANQSATADIYADPQKFVWSSISSEVLNKTVRFNGSLGSSTSLTRAGRYPTNSTHTPTSVIIALDTVGTITDIVEYTHPTFGLVSYARFTRQSITGMPLFDTATSGVINTRNPLTISGANFTQPPQPGAPVPPWIIPDGGTGYNIGVLANGGPNTLSTNINMTFDLDRLSGTKNLIAFDTTGQSTFLIDNGSGTSNLGIVAGSYIKVSSTSETGNAPIGGKIYRVINAWPSNPISDRILDDTDPYQYLEVDSEVTGELEGSVNVIIEKVDKLPILTIKYAETN